jgi:hypothetical protein
MLIIQTKRMKPKKPAIKAIQRYLTVLDTQLGVFGLIALLIVY